MIKFSTRSPHSYLFTAMKKRTFGAKLFIDTADTTCTLFARHDVENALCDKRTVCLKTKKTNMTMSHLHHNSLQAISLHLNRYIRCKSAVLSSIIYGLKMKL